MYYSNTLIFQLSYQGLLNVQYYFNCGCQNDQMTKNLLMNRQPSQTEIKFLNKPAPNLITTSTNCWCKQVEKQLCLFFPGSDSSAIPTTMTDTNVDTNDETIVTQQSENSQSTDLCKFSWSMQILVYWVQI